MKYVRSETLCAVPIQEKKRFLIHPSFLIQMKQTMHHKFFCNRNSYSNSNNIIYNSNNSNSNSSSSSNSNLLFHLEG